MTFKREARSTTKLTAVKFFGICALFFATASAIIVSPSQALAAKLCSQVHLANFWERDEAFVIGTDANNRPLYTTYSFDSEILLGDLWGFMEKYAAPDVLLEARQYLQNGFPRLSKADLMQKLGYESERQFDLFALRKGVDAGASSFQITDLNLKSLSVYHAKFKFIETRNFDFVKFLDRYFIPTVRAYGLPVDAHPDLSFPEMTHESSELSPLRYRETIKKLHSVFKKAQTHFHLGVPADLVSVDDAHEISRALEAGITLGLMRNAMSGDNENLPYSSTTFRHSPDDVDALRGVMKVEFNAFKKPFLAHDIEVREWQNVDDGLSSLQIGSELALVAAKQKLVRTSLNPELLGFDARYGSVLAVLDYVGQMLARDPKNGELAKQLRLLALEGLKETQINQTTVGGGPRRRWMTLSDSFVERVSAFIKKNEIETRYKEVLLSLRGDLEVKTLYGPQAPRSLAPMPLRPLNMNLNEHRAPEPRSALARVWSRFWRAWTN